MKTSKLSGLVLGIASMICGTLDCSMNVFVKGGVAGSALISNLVTTSKFSRSEDIVAKQTAGHWNTAEECKSEGKNFFGGVVFGLYAIKPVNRVLGWGPTAELGWSLHTDTLKDAQRFNNLELSENFFCKFGMGITITEWVMLNLGLRGTSLALKSTEANPALYAAKTDESKGAWAWGGYVDVNFLFPVNDFLKIVATLGVHSDFAASEFNKIGDKPAIADGYSVLTRPARLDESGSVIEVRNVEGEARTSVEEHLNLGNQLAQGATMQHDVNVSIQNRWVGTLGIGLLLEWK